MKKLDTSKFTTFKEFKKDLLKDPGVRAEYEKLQPHYQIARQMIAARNKQKMSQEVLAKKVGTGQAVISRLEGMNASPSISLLKRVVDGLGTPITVTIKPTTQN